MTIRFTLNGKERIVETDPMSRLLDTIRADGLTGTKEGCGEGECGACSVLIDGHVANSCITPMGTLQDCEVTTVEGLRETGVYRAIEESFEAAGATQCGFCTPGFVVATAALLAHNPNPTDRQIRDGLAGNLCRCTGYNMIVDGVRRASEMLREE